MPPKKSSAPKIANPATQKGKSRAVQLRKAPPTEPATQQVNTNRRTRRNAPAADSTPRHEETTPEVPLTKKSQSTSAKSKKTHPAAHPPSGVSPSSSAPSQHVTSHSQRPPKRTLPHNDPSDEEGLHVRKKKRAVAVEPDSPSLSPSPSSRDNRGAGLSPLSSPPTSPTPGERRREPTHRPRSSPACSTPPAEPEPSAGRQRQVQDPPDDEEVEPVGEGGDEDNVIPRAPGDGEIEEDEHEDDVQEEEVAEPAQLQFSNPEAAAIAIKQALGRNDFSPK